MKKKLISLLCFSLAALSHLHADYLLGPEISKRVFINNRILVKVNGKAITVMDVMKKMDLQFYRQFPQYSSIAEARFQFYEMQWKYTLQDMIDKELVLADAKANQLPVTAGDVRQEMESQFGPNIIYNLDKVGMRYDEAQKMIQEEMMIRRMLYIKANSKAIRKVTPQALRTAYEEFAAKNILPEKWEYQVLTIRNADPVMGAEAANFAYRYLVEQKRAVEQLAEEIKKIEPYGPSTKITITEKFTHAEKDLSPDYKAVLTTLSTHSYSKPIAQKSRSDKSTVLRIFYLHQYTPSAAPSFDKVSNKLHQELVQKAVAEETDAYLTRLREQYHVQDSYLKELTPDDFAPFVLR